MSPKILSTPNFVVSKTTLITGGVGGAGANPPTSKIGYFSYALGS